VCCVDVVVVVVVVASAVRDVAVRCDVVVVVAVG